MVPLLARVYPNGSGDVNHFHAAGGMAWVISQLLDAGLLHRDIMTVARADLTDYGKDPVLENEALTWKDPPAEPRDYSMVRPASDPFQPDGGMKLLTGRSEEHTSELQSLMCISYAVFCLKKKN